MVWAGSGEVLTRYAGHETPPCALVWSPVDERIATAGHDQTVQVWEARTGQMLTCIPCALGDCPPLAWSPDGTRLAVALADHTLRIWSL